MNTLNNFSLELVASEFRVDSRLLAPELDHRHRNIYANIVKHQDRFEKLGIVHFEKARVETSLGIREQSYAFLNEGQCYFLLTLMRNTEKVLDAKLNLVLAFENARAQLALRDMARIEGKAVRRTETDAIKSLVEYATAKGSSNANMYYANITKMTNSLLGVEKGQRDTLDHKSLQQIKIAETIVEMAIRDGLKADLPYKDIYKLCKDRVSNIAKVLLG